MKVDLVRVNDAYHFKGTGSAGISVDLDSSADSGGDSEGVRPMETLLMGLGMCSSIDIISILKKQKQKINDFQVSVEGNRDPDNIPSLFTDITVNYKLKGELNKEKVKRAIELSLFKYCSVAKILSHTADITYTFKVNEE